MILSAKIYASSGIYKGSFNIYNMHKRIIDSQYVSRAITRSVFSANTKKKKRNSRSQKTVFALEKLIDIELRCAIVYTNTCIRVSV